MDIEDLIRTTQERQADRAVSPERIRAALPRRVSRARTQRRLGLLGATVAAAAVAAAIVVPTLTVGRPAPTGQVVVPAATSAAPTTSAATEPAPLRAFKLGYQATWTPAGYHELIRYGDTGDPTDLLGPAARRHWKKQVGVGDPFNGGGAELALYVYAQVSGDARKVMDNSGQAIDVNGVKGYYTAAQGDKKSSVNWAPDKHTLLMVTAHHVDISRPDLLRMARSVRPDPGTTLVPVRLPWLPPGWSTTGALISGPSPDSWRGELFVGTAVPESVVLQGDKSKDQVGSLQVVVGNTTDAPPGGEKLTAGGRPARHPLRTDEAGQGLIYLVVDLGQGRLMTLMGEAGGITLDDLVKIAAKAEVSPDGADWLK